MKISEEIKKSLEKEAKKFDFMSTAKVGEISSAPKELADQIEYDISPELARRLQEVDRVINESYNARKDTAIKIYK